MDTITIIRNLVNIWVFGNGPSIVVCDGPFGRLWHFYKFPTRLGAVRYSRKLIDYLEAAGELTLRRDCWTLHEFGHLSRQESASERQVNYLAKIYGIPKHNKKYRAHLAALSKAEADWHIRAALDRNN